MQFLHFLGLLGVLNPGTVSALMQFLHYLLSGRSGPGWCDTLMQFLHFSVPRTRE